MTDASRLSETGAVFVTARAAEEYARAVGLRAEEARRELTERLLDARRGGHAETGAEVWRARSRATQLDITAHVARAGRLAIVVHVAVRDYL